MKKFLTKKRSYHNIFPPHDHLMPMIVKKQLLSSALVKEIQDRISKGQFTPGEKLPPQNEMASMFGVSRTALREALKQLSMMGLIAVTHGKGTFVSSFTPSTLLESLFPQSLMDRETTYDLLEARECIESVVASLAARRAEPEDVKELEILINGMQQDVSESQVESFIERDVNFHLLIAKASKNPFLAKIIQTIRDMLHKFITVSFTIMEGDISRSMNAHLRIFQAIQSHDPEIAEKEMRNHIKGIEGFVDKYYDYQENGKKRWVNAKT